MARKENDGFFDELFERGERRAKRKAKRSVKKIHTATKVIAVLALVIGIVLGAVVCLAMFKNDRFVLKGQTQFSVNVGDTFAYEEEGVEAVCFGRNVSGDLSVSISQGITQDAQGRYIIPTDKAGTYTITYTVDCYKFGEEGPNGQIKRIRVFTVNEVEEDGRNG